jgi:origin recognition complex subunit 5
VVARDSALTLPQTSRTSNPQHHAMAPDEDSWSRIYTRYPCRKLQIQTLLSLLQVFEHFSSGAKLTICQKNFPSPASLIAHGLEGTGKSSIVKAILENIGSPYAIVDSRECITGRQLLERIVSRCLDAVENSPQLPRCDSLSALHICLETIVQEKFILCLDGIDRQRDAPPTLLPALARMSEYVSRHA